MGRLVHEERLRGIHPQLVLCAKAWTVQLHFDVLITEGVRTNARQAELFAKGRTAPGTIVTNARDASQSAHGRRAFPGGAVWGCAFDAVPCTGAAGTPNYLDRPAYETLAYVAERMGLVWGGRWTTFPDGPHFQLADWRNFLPVGDDVPDFSDVVGGASTK